MELISVEKYKSRQYGNYYRYRLTEKGVETAKNILKEWKLNHSKEYEKFMEDFENKFK